MMQNNSITCLLQGLTGTGKSSLGNLLCNDEKFEVGYHAVAETQECKMGKMNFEETIFKIIDTPGTFDSKYSDAFNDPDTLNLQYMKMIHEYLTFCEQAQNLDDNITVILLVIKLDRLTTEAKEAIRILKNLEKDWKKRTLVIFTHYDAMYGNFKLKQQKLNEPHSFACYLKKGKCLNTNSWMDELELPEDEEDLKDKVVLLECYQQMTPEEQETKRKEIFSKVQRLHGAQNSSLSLLRLAIKNSKEEISDKIREVMRKIENREALTEDQEELVKIASRTQSVDDDKVNRIILQSVDAFGKTSVALISLGTIFFYNKSIGQLLAFATQPEVGEALESLENLYQLIMAYGQGQLY